MDDQVEFLHQAIPGLICRDGSSGGATTGSSFSASGSGFFGFGAGSGLLLPFGAIFSLIFFTTLVLTLAFSSFNAFLALTLTFSFAFLIFSLPFPFFSMGHPRFLHQPPGAPSLLGSMNPGFYSPLMRSFRQGIPHPILIDDQRPQRHIQFSRLRDLRLPQRKCFLRSSHHAQWAPHRLSLTPA